MGKSFQKFMVLWSGEFISAVGSGLTSFGLGVYIYEQTGKASLMALVMLLAFMPSVLLSALAGVLADRYDRRLLMIAGDSLSAVGLIYILICMMQGGAEFWQICIGVTISSVFTSLLEPAYRATITDLLTEEQYTKASGLVQMASSAKYLISPVLAGMLLAVWDIRLLLILDIGTFAITVTTTALVRKGLPAEKLTKSGSLLEEFREGWSAVSGNKGVLLLVVMGSVITFFLGFIQTLSAPMVLAFANSAVLGTAETICAMGMLVSSLLIGFLSLRKNCTVILSVALFSAGLFMAIFGLRENIVLVCISGFLFFASLPFANACLDYLLRTNIDNAHQGRAWGLVGVISQLGYIAAYIASGVLADYVFTPLLAEGGALTETVGRWIGTGVGRGTGLLIIIAGALLCITSICLYQMKAVRRLENKNLS